MITTTVVGSYPQPDWLVDRERFRGNVVPRVRMPEVWRLPSPWLESAQDDAVRLAVADMERAGVDVITDGEQRRESYFNRFANALGGIDPERPGRAIARLGRPTPVPRVVGPIERVRPVSLSEAAFLRSVTDRRIKITVPGPFTLSCLAEDEHYRDPERLAMAYAAAVNAELRELEPVVDWLQLDEPYLQAHPDRARAYGVAAIDRALAGLAKPTCIHLCFGYAYSHALAGSTKSGGYRFLPELVLKDLSSKTIVLGVLDLGDPEVETAEVVARRLERALAYVPASRLVGAPDCGMKHVPRDVARAKLAALAAGARLVA